MIVSKCNLFEMNFWINTLGVKSCPTRCEWVLKWNYRLHFSIGLEGIKSLFSSRYLFDWEKGEFGRLNLEVCLKEFSVVGNGWNFEWFWTENWEKMWIDNFKSKLLSGLWSFVGRKTFYLGSLVGDEVVGSLGISSEFDEDWDIWGEVSQEKINFWSLRFHGLFCLEQVLDLM